MFQLALSLLLNTYGYTDILIYCIFFFRRQNPTSVDADSDAERVDEQCRRLITFADV